MNVTSISDVGSIRSHNEDDCYVTTEPVGALPNFFIVADGMGGANAGEYASANVIAFMLDEIRTHNKPNSREALFDAIMIANRLLYSRAQTDVEKRGMGTTLVACVIEEDFATLVNIGDSRGYIYCGGRLMQITKDHSYVQELVDRGIISSDEARTHKDKNKITRAVGVMDQVDMDFFTCRVNRGDILLLCTDGLTNMVEDSVIATVLSEPWTVEEKGKKLVELANRNGGRDNITAVLIEV